MTAVETSARWLHRLRVGDDPDAGRIVFFPPAGSNASSAWALTIGAPSGWSVWGVQYPARGPRLCEQPAGSLREMAAACASELADAADRTILFGHSFGALVAYDVAQLLAGKDRPAAGLLVAGSSSPAVAVREMPEGGLSDEELIDFLARRGGTPPHLLANEELMVLTLPALRSDIALGRSYVDDHGRRLPTGIAALAGQDDHAVTQRHLETWRELTDTWLGGERVAGDHFSWLRDPVLMASVIDRHWPLATSDLEGRS